jgi:hypothetical protein
MISDIVDCDVTAEFRERLEVTRISDFDAIHDFTRYYTK